MGAQTLALDSSNSNNPNAIEKKTTIRSRSRSNKRKDHSWVGEEKEEEKKMEKRREIYKGCYETEEQIRERFVRELVTKGGIHDFESDIRDLKTRIVGITRILDSGLPLHLFISDIQSLTKKFHSCLRLDDSEYDARERLEKERDALVSQMVNRLEPFRTPPTTGDGTNIYVAYLSPTLDDHGLIKLFSPYGQILSAKVIKDQLTGLCKGYGYVQFAHPHHAHYAIRDTTFAPRCSHGWTTPIASVLIGITPPPGPHPPLCPIFHYQFLLQLLPGQVGGQCSNVY